MRETTPRSWLAHALIGGVLAYAVVLFVLPMSVIVYNAFKDGLLPLWNSLNQPDVQHAFFVTFSLSAIAAGINALLGVVTAWVLVRQRWTGRRIFDALIDIPFVFSPVIAGYAMIVLFGREGWMVPAIPIVFALPGVLLAKTFVSLPFVTREIQPVLREISREPEDAAYTLGAGGFTVFMRVVLPQLWTALLYGVVLTFARAMGEFGAVAVVSGSIEGYTETATSFVFRALNDRNNIGAYGVSVALGITSILILLVMAWLRQRLTPPEAQG